jgi:hypothetical protein
MTSTLKEAPTDLAKQMEPSHVGCYEVQGEATGHSPSLNFHASKIRSIFLPSERALEIGTELKRRKP